MKACKKETASFWPSPWFSDGGEIELRGLIVVPREGQRPSGLHQQIAGITALTVDPVVQIRVQALQPQGEEGEPGVDGPGDQRDQGLPPVRGNLLPGGVGPLLEGVAEAVIIAPLNQVVMLLEKAVWRRMISRSSGVALLRSIS